MYLTMTSVKEFVLSLVEWQESHRRIEDNVIAIVCCIHRTEESFEKVQRLTVTVNVFPQTKAKLIKCLCPCRGRIYSHKFSQPISPLKQK